MWLYCICSQGTNQHPPFIIEKVDTVNNTNLHPTTGRVGNDASPYHTRTEGQLLQGRQ